jgi:hypothetical protein
MATRSPFEIVVLNNGKLQYSYEGIPIYIVRDDNHSPRTGYAPRQLNLTCPPQVVPAFTGTNLTASTARTRMNYNGWGDYIKKLNRDKWEQSVSNSLAMFNGIDEWPDNDRMESLFFGSGCLLRAIQSEQKPATWAEIITLNYEAGPPVNMPTFWENPIFVQRFTVICRSGNIYLHKNDFFYPVVCSSKIYMPWSWLVRFSPDMATPFITRPVSPLLDVDL